MTDNRTTELREKLDALGIEHFDYDKGGRTQTQWEAPDGKRHFTYETSNNPAKTARLVIAWHPTPEQAIAATLGNSKSTADAIAELRKVVREAFSGESVSILVEGHAIMRAIDAVEAATLGSERELIDLAHNAWSMALCAMQGMPIPAEWGNAVECGLRKYGIDVDEELAAFEVIDDER